MGEATFNFGDVSGCLVGLIVRFARKKLELVKTKKLERQLWAKVGLQNLFCKHQFQLSRENFRAKRP